MLTHTQIRELLLVRQRKNLSLPLPVAIVKTISEFGQDSTSNFAITLKHVARGELKEAKAMLEEARKEQDKTELKTLLLQCGTVETRAGLVVQHKTLLECALGEGDPEMVAMILPYFSCFKGGEEAKEEQLKRYRPLIEGMLEQKPYDLTPLVNIIKQASAADVTAALNNDMTHVSELSEALKKFRKDVSLRIAGKPQMHYNYQTLINALKRLDDEWDNLSGYDEDTGEVHGFDKCDLFWVQIIGFLERDLPAPERFAFARGLDDAKDKISLERSTNYEYNNDSFPDISSTGSSCTGLGFDYGICDVYGANNVIRISRDELSGMYDDFLKILTKKTSSLQELVSKAMLDLTLSDDGSSQHKRRKLI